MDVPETKYAKVGDVRIAYQVVGEGPIDIVWMPSWFSHLEAMWDRPGAAFIAGLASFGRLILFDKRGVGLSDPVPLTALPTLDEWMDDLRAVMDTVGSQRAALVTAYDAGAMALLFAATFPDRTAALVLMDCFARFARASDYPWGAPSEVLKFGPEWLRDRWGTGESIVAIFPDDARDAEFVETSARFQRLAASPGTAAAMLRMTQGLDVRHVLPSIRAPALVIHREENRWIRFEHGHYLAEQISGARLLRLRGGASVSSGPDVDFVLAEIQEFLTGSRPAPSIDRVLATVMFTDLVGSTEHAARVGDHRWRELIARHDETVRHELESHRGRQIKTTGDGVLATFDGPARAIYCAQAIRERLRGLGLEVRAGLHTGEIELLGEDVGGIAVHIAARVAAMADSGEVFVSSTVKDLVAGSGIEFEDRGSRELKGVPGEWRLFAVRT